MLKQEGRIDHQKPSTSRQEKSVQEEVSLISSDEVRDSDGSGRFSSSSFEVSMRPKLPTKKKTRIELQALDEACDRAGLSDRAA